MDLVDGRRALRYFLRPLAAPPLAARRPAGRLLVVPALALAVAFGSAVGGCGDTSAAGVSAGDESAGVDGPGEPGGRGQPGGPGQPGGSGEPTVTATDVLFARATLGAQFTLAQGQVAEIAGSAVAFTFVEVSADSRCPATTECVWEGDAVVELRAVTLDPSSGPRRTQTAVQLHTNPSLPAVVSVPPYTVTLVRLTPAPSTDELAQSRYRATLQVDAA